MPTDRPFNDYARRQFVAHLLQLISSDAAHHAAGYQLVDLTVGPLSTTLEFDSDSPLVTAYRVPDDTNRTVHYGTRRITVTVEAAYDRIPDR